MADESNGSGNYALAALRISEARYRRLFETARDGILLLNVDTAQIEDVNPYLIELLGYSHSEFLGKKLWEVGAFADIAQSKDMFAIIQEKGYVRYADLPLKTKAGVKVAVEFVSNSYDCEGVKVIQCNIRDISERNQAEALRISLEEQLQESQKMEAIGTLAGGIAHDFNNIIATILGNADLALEDTISNHSAQRSIEEIRKAGRRARDLVQQILSFSRKQPMERKCIALKPVVEESVRLMRATFPACVRINFHCTDAPDVMADATQIEQALLNLATNSMQAAHGGPQSIDIGLDTVILDASFAEQPHACHAMRLSQPTRTARLTVRDEGEGMDAETMGRIFEPFFTTKPMGEGTGLGLSVVRGILQAHEGAVVVDSQPAKGTTFTLYLPIATAQKDTSKKPAGLDGMLKIPTVGAGRRLLYIDDDESIVSLLKRLLERRGYVVSGFVDARAAIERLRKDPYEFELVLTDYNMPFLSGLDVARAVQNIRSNLPVAIVSGFIDERLLSQAKGSGVRELIVKSIDTAEFCDSVDRLMGSIGNVAFVHKLPDQRPGNPGG